MTWPLALVFIAVAFGAGVAVGPRLAARGRTRRRTEADNNGSATEHVRGQLVEQAVDGLRLGVVVYTATGTELYRNRVGLEFATARHGEALVEAALERVVEAALIGLSTEEEVKLYGPPVRVVLAQASPTWTDDQITGVVATIEDVTQIRHVDQVRSDFVANVSHELRTPVGAMSVLAETLAETADLDVKNRLAARIEDESRRLAETIEDLLILSRLESDRDEPNETFDLLSVATMAMDRTMESSAQRTVTVELDARVDGPVLVDGQLGQLVTAVSNLIENATKYSSAGSTVAVMVDVSTEDGERQGVLSVIDHGIGIPEASLARIFERFYRVDGARSRDTGGTGLGLSIVRNTVTNHGGTVEVESVEGSGSTFTLRMPLSPADLQVNSADVDDLLVDQEKKRTL